MDFKLSNKAKKILLAWGHPEEELKQIEMACNVGRFSIKTNKRREHLCTWQRAKRVLGTETFLSGLSRAAFHWTSGRYSDNGYYYVSFDCSKLFV